MKFFPYAWAGGLPDGPICDAPLGEACTLCLRPIEPGQLGVLMIHMLADGDAWRPQHRECFLDALGINPDAPVCERCGTRHRPPLDH